VVRQRWSARFIGRHENAPFVEDAARKPSVRGRINDVESVAEHRYRRARASALNL
jgi:hypothetical protein